MLFLDRGTGGGLNEGREEGRGEGIAKEKTDVSFFPGRNQIRAGPMAAAHAGNPLGTGQSRSKHYF